MIQQVHFWVYIRRNRNHCLEETPAPHGYRSITCNSQARENQSGQQWVSGQRKCDKYVHTHAPTLEYYSAIKKKEMLLLATTWIDLEGVMLSEISQPEKDKYGMTSLPCRIPEKPNSYKQRTDRWLPGAGDGGNGERWSKDTNFQL